MQGILVDSLWDMSSWFTDTEMKPHKEANQEQMTSTDSSIICPLSIFFQLHLLDATLKRPMS